MSESMGENEERFIVTVGNEHGKTLLAVGPFATEDGARAFSEGVASRAYRDRQVLSVMTPERYMEPAQGGAGVMPDPVPPIRSVKGGSEMTCENEKKWRDLASELGDLAEEFRSAWLNSDRSHTEAEWEDLAGAERELDAALSVLAESGEAR